MAATARLNPETQPLLFHCKDLLARDAFVLAAEASDSDDARSFSSGDAETRAPARSKLSNRRFQILLFGTDEAGRSISLAVDNFRPFFYVRIPDVLAKSAAAHRNLITWMMHGVPADAAPHTSMEIETHKTLWDFNAGTAATFLKITVPSQALWRSLKDRLLTAASEPIVYESRSMFGAAAVPTLRTAPRATAGACADVASLSDNGSHIALKVYEANIDPVLRFFHIQDVSPAGWIRVEAGDWDFSDSRDTKTDVSAVCSAGDVKAGPDGMAPFLMGSWDIECNSSHGDFPLAVKTWLKPVRELFELGMATEGAEFPTSVEALCEMLAAAINGTSAKLSPIYLKRKGAGAMLGETLRLMLEGKAALRQTADALVAVRGAFALKGDARDAALKQLEVALTKGLPAIAGDEIIQIGTVLYRRGTPVSKHIWVLGTVKESDVRPPGAEVPIQVFPFADEAAMLRSWLAWIGRNKVDILIGYNIFGFDSKYVYDRLVELVGAAAVKNYVEPLSCLRSRPPRLERKELSSSAMGDNVMHFLGMPGRLQIDLMLHVKRNHNLDSYSLDNVSKNFVSDDILSPLVPASVTPAGGAGDARGSVGGTGDQFRFTTKSTKGLMVGRYIALLDEENDSVVNKCLVAAVEPKAITIHIEGGAATLADNGGTPVKWAQVKDDVSPKDIFRLHRGSAADRAIIARYCLQDCDLVMELFNKLEVLNNSVAMANVCSVPVGYIFMRGQGIKIESLIFKECRRVDQLIEVLPSAPRGTDEAETTGGVEGDEDDEDDEEDEGSYEGAIVLKPQTGIYLDDPVTADDFASLYPSTIISENISHDTLIWVKDYDVDGKFVCVREGSDKYDNLPGAKYVNVEFDILRADPADKRKHPAKIRDGTRVARYIQPAAAGAGVGIQGTIPRILEMLLDSRKRCRKLIATEPDEFRKALLDAQQLAYKLTANSLYGQLGSATFKIRRQVLAASTTGYGRKQLMFAKAVIEEVYGGGKDPRCDVECVYGDTDSIFLRFRPRNPTTGERLHGAEALKVAKDLTIESGKLVSSCLKPPHDFEFDKIFKSFILLSKKRYVGDMSEDGLEDGDFHRKSMGIVMKRRDNAPIVKYVYGNAVNEILKSNSVEESVKTATAFVQNAARDLLAGKFALNKLTITKSLSGSYKDPKRIAHKVLADRIGERDPGNKPNSNDRIPFVYISHGAGPAPKLQGDRIELPSYILEKGLTPDYAFYITNQIAKPISQVFGLAVEHMPRVSAVDLAGTAKARSVVKAREKLASDLLFQQVLVDAARRPEAMEAKGQKSIASMFAAAAKEKKA